MSFPLSIPFTRPDLPNESGKSYSHKSILTSFLILLCCLHLLFNHALALAENKNITDTLIPQIKSKIKQQPTLICGVYIKPSWTKSEININGDSLFPAASLIKIPIAVALLQKIDKGELSWDKVLILKKYHYARGAGFLRTRKIGTRVKLKEAFKLMLTISDNTATHMIIDALGGYDALNNQISKLGLKNTKLVSRLDDFSGSNKTSPHDMVSILEKSLQGDLLKDSSRKYFKNILLKVNNKSLIKKGLGKYTRFAHKTGTIGICVGDAGIMYLPFGKRIGISVIVKRPFNSLQGKTIIREISKIVYENLA